MADAERSREFYAAALAPLGIVPTLAIAHEGCEPGGDQAQAGGSMFGFAAGGAPWKPFFWVLGDVAPGQGLHVAFAAATRAQVDALHAAALAAGGPDNGAPGIRHYHPDYYGGFVRDPDGHNVEAVCHAPE